MSIQIHVTQEHIDKGTPRMGYSCPVALAIKDATGHRPVVSTLGIVCKHSLVDVPSPVDSFIRAFDAGEPVQPFTFELEISR